MWCLPHSCIGQPAFAGCCSHYQFDSLRFPYGLHVNQSTWNPRRHFDSDLNRWPPSRKANAQATCVMRSVISLSVIKDVLATCVLRRVISWSLTQGVLAVSVLRRVVSWSMIATYVLRSVVSWSLIYSVLATSVMRTVLNPGRRCKANSNLWI